MMDKEQEQKKAWLREYRLSMERVRSLAEELHRWQDIAEKATQSFDPVPTGGGSSDRVGNAAAMIADIQHEIEQEIAFAKEARKERAQSINAVQHPRYSTVLRMYYIAGMSFFNISCVLGKSERNIQDIHRKAIKQIGGENID